MKQTHINQEEKNTPITEYRVGGVRATIWENTHTNKEGTTFTTQTVNIERRYKNQKTNEWASTNTYTLSQLQQLRHAITQAEAYLLTGRQEDEVDT